MKEQEENIQFDNMPNFSGMFATKADNWDDDKVYDSLYDELCDKCHPNHFLDGDAFDQNRFNKANLLYSEILQHSDSTEDDLLSLRDRAMDELGVTISTKRKFDYLNGLLNPEVYTNMQPYDAERVCEAGKWYALLIQRKSDIRALESLEIAASGFIDKRLNELKVIEKKEIAEREAAIKREEKERLAKEEENEDMERLIGGIIFILVLVGIIIAIISSNK